MAEFQPTSSSWIWFWTPCKKADGRRLEVVVDGFLLFKGALIAIDTTLLSPLQGDGQLHRRCADVDGAAHLLRAVRMPKSCKIGRLGC